MEYLRSKLTPVSRRGILSSRSKRTAADKPPRLSLHIAVPWPCSACTLPADCPVPGHEVQLPWTCARHLMLAGRTWACIYNVNSWCCYTGTSSTCYAQDSAPDGELHRELLVYRDLEQRAWSVSSDKSRAELLHKLVLAKKELLLHVGVERLRVCVLYPEYRALDREAVVNKTDPEIPRLLTSGAARLKGCDTTARIEV